MTETMPLTESGRSSRRRAPWRQRLVDAERGLSVGLRSDSTLYFYLFVNCILLAVGGVLDLSFLQWLIVGLAVAFVIAAELMQQALRALICELRDSVPSADWERPLHLATASVALAFAGSALVIVLIYWQRVSQMFAE